MWGSACFSLVSGAKQSIAKHLEAVTSAALDVSLLTSCSPKLSDMPKNISELIFLLMS